MSAEDLGSQSTSKSPSENSTEGSKPKVDDASVDNASKEKAYKEETMRLLELGIKKGMEASDT